MTEQGQPESTGRKAPIRSLADVEAATPLELATMSLARVEALPQVAAERRLHIITNAHDTYLGLPDIMKWLGVGRSSVSRWRWRQRCGDPVDGVRTVLIAPFDEEYRSPNGATGPRYRLSDLIPWAILHKKISRTNLVPFKKPRNDGKVPDSIRTKRAPAPSQQRRRVKEQEAESNGTTVAA